MSRTAFSHVGVLTGLLAGWIFAIGGCSSTELKPGGTVPSLKAPEYVQAPHPAGFDVTDLRGIFGDRQAPPPESLRACNVEYSRLTSMTKSEVEQQQGARELVRQDPIYYHWCFYGQILALEDQIKADDYVEDKQKHVLETYSFVVPIGRAFMAEFQDSRYVRWAVRHYRTLSEHVFFRKLDLTPKMTFELVEAATPFGFAREDSPKRPVLEKYNLVRPPMIKGGPADVRLSPPPVPEAPPTADSNGELEQIPEGVPSMTDTAILKPVGTPPEPPGSVPKPGLDHMDKAKAPANQPGMSPAYRTDPQAATPAAVPGTAGEGERYPATSGDSLEQIPDSDPVPPTAGGAPKPPAVPEATTPATKPRQAVPKPGLDQMDKAKAPAAQSGMEPAYKVDGAESPPTRPAVKKPEPVLNAPAVPEIPLPDPPKKKPAPQPAKTLTPPPVPEIPIPGLEKMDKPAKPKK